MKSGSIKKNMVLNFIRVLMQILFPLISFPYASRILMADGIGKVNFSSSIVAYFILFASLGISSYGVRNGAKFRTDKDKLSIFTQELFLINIITTVITYIVFLFCIFFIPKFSTYRYILLVLSLNIVCTPLGIDWLYGALEDFEYITKRSILFQFISLILLFLLVKDSNDVVQYAFITAFSTIGSNIFNLYHSRKYIKWKNFNLCEYNFFRHIKPILTIFGVNLACNVYMNLDKTMLGVLVNDYEVGIYTAAYKVNTIVLSFVNAVGAVLLPRLSSYIFEGKIEEYRVLFIKSFNIVCMIAIPACIGLILLSPELILLLSGEQFYDAIPTMRILSLLIIISGMGTTFSVQLFVANNMEKVSLIASTSAAITNFFANLIFIPKYGASGAAIGTILCEIVALLVCLLNAKKILNLYCLFNSFYTYIIGGVIVFFGVVFVKTFPINDLMIIFISTLSGCVLYFFTLYILKNEYILELIAEALSKLKTKKRKSM